MGGDVCVVRYLLHDAWGLREISNRTYRRLGYYKTSNVSSFCVLQQGTSTIVRVSDLADTRAREEQQSNMAFSIAGGGSSGPQINVTP